MSTNRSPDVCPRCGTPLPPNAAENLCPRCLFARLDMGDDETPALPPGIEAHRFAVETGRLESGWLGNFDDYELIEEIGDGGMGTVYSARQVSLNRLVAIKVIKLGMDTRGVMARFAAERQTLALMDHPAIARVFDAGATATGRPFFAMELVRGAKITEYCEGRQLGTRDRLELFIRVCQAVQHAHQKGVIHRDLKPSNILVVEQDGEAVPKVIDFGIAKAIETQATDRMVVTEFGQLVGTPAYLSPEQAALGGGDVDTRSDIYSLGVLLYELLTGQLPFEPTELSNASLEEVRRTIREKRPMPPSTRLAQALRAAKARGAVESAFRVAHSAIEAPTWRRRLQEVRGDLDWIVMKCLEKDRARRYVTANGLASDLRRHLHHEPVVARPPSRRYEFERTVRRHWVGFAAVTAVMVALALGIVVSSFELARARRAEREEVRERARTERALVVHELEAVEGLLNKDRASEALAYLARLIRQDPSNRVATARLLSILSQRTFALPVCQPLPHAGVVYTARFSPDGSRLVTASSDTTARVWDAVTGQPVFPPLQHGAEVDCADFSRDGTRIVTGGRDRTARIWDAQTGLPRGAPLPHEDAVSLVVVGRDGDRFATAAGAVARVWDFRTGQAVTAPLLHQGGIRSLEFSLDGRWLLASGGGKILNVWQAASGELGRRLTNNAAIQSSRFSPDASLILAAGYDGHVTVWEFASGKQLARIAHEDVAEDAAFSPDGTLIATASRDRTARLWDSHTGGERGQPLVHVTSVVGVRFSADGQNLLTICANGTVSAWDVMSRRRLVEPLRHDRRIGNAEFSPDAQRILTASDDRTAVVWDIRSVRPKPVTLSHAGPAFAKFSPDGSRLLTWSFDCTARVWDAQTGLPVSLPLRHRDWIAMAGWSPDGHRVVTGSVDGSAAMWDAGTGELVYQPLRHGGGIDDVEFSRQGDRLVTVGRDCEARTWDAHTGRLVGEPLRHPARVWAGCFSPDGTRVATACADKFARVWDARSGQLCCSPLEHEAAVGRVSFARDSRHLVTASFDTTARVWDTTTSQPTTPPLKHFSQVLWVEFAPDGNHVVTASSDGTARLWDAQTGAPVGDPLRHDGGVTMAHFSHDGNCLVTTSSDRTARIWETASGLPLTEPLRHESAVVWADFSPDERRLVTGARNGRVRLWEVPLVSAAAPAWLAPLAEAAACQRLDRNGQLEYASPGDLLDLLEEAASAGSDRDYSQLVQSTFASRLPRGTALISSEATRILLQSGSAASSMVPLDLELLLSRAVALALTHDLPAAITACMEALEATRGDAAARDVRANALLLRRGLRLGLGQTNEAKADLLGNGDHSASTR